MNKNISEHTVNPIRDNIPLMAESCWQLAVLCLWPCSTHSAAEKQQVRAMLRNRLLQAIDPYKTYLELGQRIQLTRLRLIRIPAYAISEIPTQWLHPNNKRGLEDTAGWYQAIQEKRKKLPLYKLVLRALPEAALELAEEPSSRNFHYWVQWFKEKQAHNELMLFSLFAANLHYQNDQP